MGQFMELLSKINKLDILPAGNVDISLLMYVIFVFCKINNCKEKFPFKNNAALTAPVSCVLNATMNDEQLKISMLLIELLNMVLSNSCDAPGT